MIEEQKDFNTLRDEYLDNYIIKVTTDASSLGPNSHLIAIFMLIDLVGDNILSNTFHIQGDVGTYESR